MKNRLLTMTLILLLAGCSQLESEIPTNISDVDIFTQSSKGKSLYNLPETPIKGVLGGKDIGFVGTISSQGKLTLNLPDDISDDILDSRPNTNVKGGGLTTIPDIKLWKNDNDFLHLVYMNSDYKENGTEYKKGWNFATNEHKKAKSADGYKWIFMDVQKEGFSSERIDKDNKSVLILSSSPRKGGNSNLLCDSFMKGAKEAGHQVEKINLNDMEINFLSNTEYTDMSGSAYDDDVPMIVEKMIQADVIVMATPTFFYAMSGQMKTMIDRTYERHKEMMNKEFYFIVAGADNNPDNLKPVVQEFHGFLKSLANPIERGVIYGAGAWDKGSVEKTPAMKEAFEMGKGV